LGPFRNRTDALTFVSVGSTWQRPLARAVSSRAWSDGIVIHERLASRSFLESTASTMPIIAWAVETRERARSLVTSGVAGLIIDDPVFMSEVRADIYTNHGYPDFTT